MEGYFQDERYFLEQKINFSSYCEFLNPNINQIELNEKLAYLTLGVEYKRHKNFILPKHYWLNAIKLMKKGAEKFIIVTDDKRYCNNLFPNYEVISGSIKECFFIL